MQGLIDCDENESVKNKILEFVSKKEKCEGYNFYELLYDLPTFSKKIINEKVSSNNLDDDSLT